MLKPTWALVIFLALASPIAAQRTYVLTGTLVTPRGILEHGSMLISGDRIREIGATVNAAPDVPRIAVEGVVFPGLIDLHNHLTWNVLPRWHVPKPVGDRYDWQAMPDYAAKLSGPQGSLMRAGEGCDMERYAEVKALLNGGTSLVGSFHNDCTKGLARNLDVYSGLYSDKIDAEPLRYEVFPFEIAFDQAQQIRDSLGTHKLRAVIVHVGEGKDASARREFRMLRAAGFIRPGVSIIHGVGLGEAEFREMAANGVGFIWSPKSNLELYGETADIASAVAANVTIALAPDWSPSGTSGMLEELRVAMAWNREHGNVLTDAMLFQMVAGNPALLAGAIDNIGALAPGLRADFIVLPKTSAQPLDALVNAKPGSIDLAVIDGKPLLGSPATLGKFADAKDLDEIELCGYRKALNVRQDLGGEAWPSFESRLKAAIAKTGTSLAGLSECKVP